MRNWPEDAQPDRPEGVGASGDNAEDENLRETRVLPLNEKPVRPGTGPDSIEDRWARLGVFPSGADRTQVLPDAGAHRAEPPAGGPATPSRDARESPWDAERTTALRVPREPGGNPGDRQGGPRPPYDSGRTGAPTAPRHPASAGGGPASKSPASGSPPASSEAETSVFPPVVGRPSSGAAAGVGRSVSGPASGPRSGSPEGETSVFQPPTGRRPSGAPGGLGRPAAGGPRPASADPATAVFPPATGDGAPGSPATTGTDAPTELLKPASRATVRDPWQEDAGASGAATHDPHEVTVQLDSVQIGEGLELRRAAPGRAGGGQEAAAGPVFVDESGRRSRLYRRIGMAVGLACAGYAVVMVATLLSGNSDAPWMPVPGQEDKPAGQVETTPEPAETDTTPSAGTGVTPGSTPTTGAPTATAPGATAPATGGGTGGTADQPGSVDPSPTTTRRNDTGKPATGGGGDTTSTPSGDTVSTAPASPPVSDEPDPVTTAPTGGGGEADGSDPRVAGAPADQPVVVSDGSAAPPATSTTPAAPSPENVV
ncbi:hypothetical protein [Streptomyces sp. NPDC048584]|uniref:hypothetical protein n=1 Tax=Streptomyces sp. NPDC048584 TaxID=3365573 RepID=UPI00372400EB